jgi:hypothetical protein
MRGDYTVGRMPFLPFTQVELTCEQCGRRFLCSKKAARKGARARRFCTPACGYAWRTRRSEETALARLWAKVDKDGPAPGDRPDLGACWIGASRRPDGYVTVYVAGRTVLGHRLAYESASGPIPDGLELDHLCRRPGCVRPSHLEAVTHRENIARGASPAWITHQTGVCQRGHVMTGKALMVVGTTGARLCRVCVNARSLLRYHEAYERRGRPRGDEHHGAKLTEQAVRAMRADHAAGTSVYALARAHGISRATAWNVVNRKTWRHVP